MAAGLPKTCQQFEAPISPPLWGEKRSVWARVLGRPSPWKRRLRWFFYAIPLISLCSFAVPQQFDFSATRTLATSSKIARTPSGVNIVCLGDSLTQGVGASRGHDYPSLLSQSMGTAVINAGVDGDETVDALKRLESDVLAKDPRLVIVELGANDVLDGQPLKQAFENLDEIVRRIEEHGAMVVLVGLAPGPLGDTLQQRYDTIIHKYHVAFVPKVLEGIVTNPALKSEDHLHPNDQGYELIAERIQRVVTPLLVRQQEEFGRPPQQ